MINDLDRRGINNVPYIIQTDKTGDFYDSGTLGDIVINKITYYSPSVVIMKGSLVKEDNSYRYYAGWYKKSFRLRVAISSSIGAGYSNGTNLKVPTFTELKIQFPFNGTWIEAGMTITSIDLYTMSASAFLMRNDLSDIFRIFSFNQISVSSTDRFYVGAQAMGLIRIPK